MCLNAIYRTAVFACFAPECVLQGQCGRFLVTSVWGMLDYSSIIDTPCVATMAISYIWCTPSTIVLYAFYYLQQYSIFVHTTVPQELYFQRRARKRTRHIIGNRPIDAVCFVHFVTGTDLYASETCTYSKIYVYCFVFRRPSCPLGISG